MFITSENIAPKPAKNIEMYSAGLPTIATTTPPKKLLQLVTLRCGNRSTSEASCGPSVMAHLLFIEYIDKDAGRATTCEWGTIEEIVGERVEEISRRILECIKQVEGL